MKKIILKWSVGIAIFMITSIAFGRMMSQPEITADQLRDKANKIRQEAMGKDCGKIGERISFCFSGDRRECEKMHDSIAWFTSEYGSTPEIACVVDNFLALGGD